MPTRRALFALPALLCRGRAGTVTLFLAGDVMTGRAIDQILPHPSGPQLREPFMRSVLGYLRLAERASGPIPKAVSFAYIWGDALRELEQRQPDLRIVNLETSITVSEDWLPKGINYRMHPDNAGCLTAARLDCCVLANNHVLDFGQAGLLETLETLRRAKIRTAGAGRNLEEARSPASRVCSCSASVLLAAEFHRTGPPRRRARASISCPASPQKRQSRWPR